MPANKRINAPDAQSRELETNEAAFRALFDNMALGAGIFKLLFNKDGRPCDFTALMVNAAFERQSELKADQIRGRNMSEFVPDLEPIWLDKLGLAVAEQKAIVAEEYSSYIGQWLNVEVVPLPAKDTFACIFYDAAERSRAERDIHESELAEAKSVLERTVEERTRELKKSEAKYRSLVETTNDGFWWADPDGRIIEASKGIAALLGYTVDELVGKHWSDMVSQEWMGKATAEVSNRLRGKSTRYEFLMKRKDGSQVWVLVSGSPVLDDQGRYAGTLSAFTDINDRKHAEEELRRSNEELQQFAYVASHDLREPLRMISSYLELLERKYDGRVLDERAKEYMHYAVDGSLRMQRMIDDLLTYARVETRRNPRTEVDMNEALATAMRDLKTKIEESGAEIVHEPLPTIMADGKQMVVLLSNLLSNAIKFRSEESPRINISAGKTDDEWIFCINDNGIGMDPSQTGRLFQMFVRLHSRHEFEGTGIGLAICNKIVERHGGIMCVTTKTGEGSTFYFTIPSHR